ncbi:alpha-ketoglutarate-dependent 2,4-dichlorophenoxyacetate dioxygenase [Mycolicibacterium hassiacum DSM 44199]|jgi:alpha-ketoglutarate-dependent taurine dioxygenase|uniref:Alpha-ketoglutarate-dependent 2,4-dichlorophenoxyacetate dioxygenase n=1 Tax=Mycolicibacterium hassiacum (strain DSM 44199 / CIP 105218 / JCM 12690 / 3849) TaxID=1122247 RepID=K5BD01_MYCHD|nr:TauD/TfdA family dioxygenase [Mycolicibacterium hassiacum]EKF25585.1 alpha-ketoglutarate-dependent 2,4-dichlorophenoxyacetate dioxygenase [Mycolicibacterium hassiacum DSM 44199]MBX5485152.1 TauD/TfdA family dioxygenase [Mycolicibacterium hassiacum]MDA4084505.1 taurine catabolism dioxygenase TauD/TfdA [Mycolicibacterium hassiacum DSM 44199]PZN24042.1 MAG: TauD/TfdA family dioxygenase [Mycolicibacterium hassiacum]VCT90860.1 (S)-phenoxypropionate/alpha-ketoglutarate-dioxygenase [Mycolicibacter
MTLTITKLTAFVGAQVTGVDADRLAGDDALAAEVLEALETHGVLVFPRLGLSPEAQVAFCRRLGEVDHSSDGHHPVAGIYPVSLDPAKNTSAAYLRATFDWHIDGCTPVDGGYPQKATVLTAVQVADRGGETEFASSYAAYDALSEQEKRHVESLRVVHSLEASQRRVNPDPTPEELARWRARPTHEHPLVWTHRSGRRSLVLGASADYVVGMDREAGRALLEDLLARATVAERVYRHHWSVGDTVIWDNRGVLHRAAPYAPDSAREMLRTTVLGDEPIE